MHLLRGALHPLASRWHVVVLVHTTTHTLCPSLLAFVNVIQIEVLNHGIRWWRVLVLALAKKTFQLRNVLRARNEALWREFDIKLDVQVTVIVMAV